MIHLRQMADICLCLIGFPDKPPYNLPKNAVKSIWIYRIFS